MPKRTVRRLTTSKKCTPRREFMPRLRPGLFSISRSADYIGAARAAGVPRALELPDASGRCPRRAAWRPADAERGCWIAPAARSLEGCRLDPGGQVAGNDGVSPTGRPLCPSISTLQMPISRAAAMRRCVVPVAGQLAWHSAVAESVPEGCCRGGCLCASVLCESRSAPTALYLP